MTARCFYCFPGRSGHPLPTLRTPSRLPNLKHVRGHCRRCGVWLIGFISHISLIYLIRSCCRRCCPCCPWWPQYRFPYHSLRVPGYWLLYYPSPPHPNHCKHRRLHSFKFVVVSSQANIVFSQEIQIHPGQLFL